MNTRHKTDRHTLYGVLIYLGVLLLVGMLGYFFIERDFTLFDALYMTIITITTVGFHEVHPLSPAGQAFTIVVLILGFGVVALAATQLTRFVIERELSGVFGRKKMMKRIKQITNHYILCGFDDITQAICLKLAEYNVPFVIIAADEGLCEQARERDYPVLEGDPAKDTTLIMAGIQRAAGIVAGLPSDAENLFITLAARELHPGIHIITRGNDAGIKERMQRAGADTVVYPLKLGGQQIARLISRQCGIRDTEQVADPGITDPGVLGYYLRTYRTFGEEQTTVETARNSMNAMQVVALKKADGTMLPYPPPDENVTAGDILIMLVNDEFAADARALDTQPAKSQGSTSWSDELSVGILSIDEEHRRIFGMINRLEKAINQGRGKDVLAEVFDDLLEYTATHFRHEEKLFDAYRYPDREAHREEHRRMTRQVAEMNRDKAYIFPENVAEFLRNWLRGHILKTDRKYADFLQQQGAE
jgi:voltage-gated potassium channel